MPEQISSKLGEADIYKMIEVPKYATPIYQIKDIEGGIKHQLLLH